MKSRKSLRGFAASFPSFKKPIDTGIVRIIRFGEIASIRRKWFESPSPPSQASFDMSMPDMMVEFVKSPKK